MAQHPDDTEIADASQQEEAPDWGINYRADSVEISEQNRPVSTRDLIGWSIQIAQGMDYLAKKKVLLLDSIILHTLLITLASFR